MITTSSCLSRYLRSYTAAIVSSPFSLRGRIVVLTTAVQVGIVAL